MAVSLDDLLTRYPGADSFSFGDNRELSDELLALVRAGTKTATCGSLRQYEAEGWPMPVAGRCDVILDWDGKPAVVIELTEVTVRRFCDVDADFALSEGEDDDLAGWQAGHRRYFERNGGWDPEMELVCQRFRLVEDLA
ncbi:ASCH domain-containing protein [Rhodobacterales bacterium HKCCE3408]|nr:ASCH domain-containing protein [Rhodobacterales bacterium HKCCE3408]